MNIWIVVIVLFVISFLWSMFSLKKELSRKEIEQAKKELNREKILFKL